jgi:hypothetical protein
MLIPATAVADQVVAGQADIGTQAVVAEFTATQETLED